MDITLRSQLREFGQSALRIGAGILFFSHGAQKLFGWFGGFGPEHGTVPLFSQLGAAGIIEIAGGLLLVLGLFTRVAAFLMSGEMAVAYVQVHTMGGHDARWWTNGGELALLYSFVWLFFACAGAGAFSLDAWRKREHVSEPRFRRVGDTVPVA